MTIYDTRHSSRPAVVSADDGRELPATWYLPEERPRGAVLIAPAMATPARFYSAFAWWLAAQGFATLTFDYRGTGSRAAMKAETGDLVRWYGDAASALEHLVEDAPDVPVTWLGHSLGGQALPFVRHDLVDRALLVASGSGYWRDSPPAVRYRAPFFFRVVVPLAIGVSGYYPGRRLGLLGDVPPNVMRQWARWCLHPRLLRRRPRPRQARRRARAADHLPVVHRRRAARAPRATARSRSCTPPRRSRRTDSRRLTSASSGSVTTASSEPRMEPAWERVVLPHLAVR